LATVAAPLVRFPIKFIMLPVVLLRALVKLLTLSKLLKLVLSGFKALTNGATIALTLLTRPFMAANTLFGFVALLSSELSAVFVKLLSVPRTLRIGREDGDDPLRAARITAFVLFAIVVITLFILFKI